MLTLAVYLLLSPNTLGAAAFAHGHYALAERCFRAAWQRQPDANVASNLGAVARRLGKLAEAERWFSTVLALRQVDLGPAHPDTVIALHNRGVLRLALGQHKSARADLEVALALVKPGTADQAAILASLGHLALDQARLAEAQRLCAQAAALHAAAARVCQSNLHRIALAANEH